MSTSKLPANFVSLAWARDDICSTNFDEPIPFELKSSIYTLSLVYVAHEQAKYFFFSESTSVFFSYAWD